VSDFGFLPAGRYSSSSYYSTKAHILKWAAGSTDNYLLPFQSQYLNISLAQYTKRRGNSTPLRCPSRDVPWLCNSGSMEDVTMHYALNYFTTGLLDSVADEETSENITLFKRPSSTIHIADSGDRGYPFDTTVFPRVGTCHNKETNLLWIDGHVSIRSYTKLKNWEINPKVTPSN